VKVVRQKRYVNQKQLAEIVGISTGRMCRIVAAGKLGGAAKKEKGKNRYRIDLEAAMIALGKNLDPARAHKSLIGDGAEEQQSDGGGGGSYIQERTKSIKYQALLKKLQYERERGRYLETAVVVEALRNAARIFRDHALNITPRLAPIIALESDEKTVAAMMNKEFAEALKNLEAALRAAAANR
jgi:hypothetical protein